MPEGLRFSAKVQSQSSTESGSNCEGHPDRLDMRQESVVNSTAILGGNGAYEMGARRGSFRNGFSGKKVSFKEDGGRESNSVPTSPTGVDGGQAIRLDSAVAATCAVARRQSSVAIQRTQSQREAKKATSNAAAVVPDGARNDYCAVRRAKRSASFRESLRQGENYQVLMLGAVGVGKSSLVQQFQRANNAHVSVKVSNVYGDNCRRANDAQLTILDNPAMEITADMAIACCDVDAYIVVYSVTDRESLKTAEQILRAICTRENCNKKAAILVGNKVDLVRRRVINNEEGKSCATSHGCKFIETSDWIDYNVDELFEGVLAQIRLRLDSPNCKDGRRRRGYRRSKTLGTKSWGMLKDFISKINRKVKSCDDLHVL